MNHRKVSAVYAFASAKAFRDVQLWRDEDYNKGIRQYVSQLKVCGMLLGEYMED